MISFSEAREYLDVLRSAASLVSQQPSLCRDGSRVAEEPGVLELIRMSAFHKLFKSCAFPHQSVTEPAVKYTLNDQAERIMGRETIHTCVLTHTQLVLSGVAMLNISIQQYVFMYSSDLKMLYFHCFTSIHHIYLASIRAFCVFSACSRFRSISLALC